MNQLLFALLAFSYFMSPSHSVRYFGDDGALCALHFIRLEGAYNLLETWCNDEQVATIWNPPTGVHEENVWTPRIEWKEYGSVLASSDRKTIRNTVYLAVIR